MPRAPSASRAAGFVSPIWGKLQNQRARKLKNVVKWADATKTKTKPKKKNKQQIQKKNTAITTTTTTSLGGKI